MMIEAVQQYNMASDVTSEDENLKKQIAYLTSLIDNAKNEKKRKEPIFQQENHSFVRNHKTADYFDVERNRQQHYASHLRNSSYPNPKINFSNPSLLPQHQTQKKAQSQFPKFSTKFKWEKKEEEKPVQHTVSIEKPLASFVNTKVPTCSSAKSYSILKKQAKENESSLKNVSKGNNKSAMGKANDSTAGASKESDAKVDKKTKKVQNASPPGELTSVTALQQSLKLEKELHQMQAKINSLMEKIENNVKGSVSPVKIPLRAAIHREVAETQGTLLTRSLYKMERVSPQKKLFLKSEVPRLSPGLNNHLSLDNTKSVSDKVIKSRFSLQRLNSTSVSSRFRNPSENPALKNEIVIKRKYSLKRVRPTSVNSRRQSSDQKLNSNKAIVIKKSRYSIHRVRGEFGSVSMLNRSARLSSDGQSSISLQSPAQIVARTIKSKYKIRKVPATPPGKLLSYNFWKGGTSANNFNGRSKLWFTPQNWGDRLQSRKLKPIHRKTNLSRFKWDVNQDKHRWDTMQSRKSSLGYKYQGSSWSRSKYFVPKSKSLRKKLFTWNKDEALAQQELLIQKRIKLLKKKVKFDPKLRLDRRTDVSTSTNGGGESLNFVMVNGMLYKAGQSSRRHTPLSSEQTSAIRTSSGTAIPQIKTVDGRNMKTVTVRGIKFKMDAGGRSLKRVNIEKKGVAEPSRRHLVSRVDVGGITYIQTRPGTLERLGSTKTRHRASQAVNRSLVTAAMKYRKDNTRQKTKKKYCMFFNRFGKCNRQGDCPFVHDPDKVAVCTRFLRGTCKVDNCPFSHKMSREKMPVCSYFLRGMCHRDDCPYRHVNVSRDAEICPDFLDGFCPQGDKCKKKHTLVCPEFTQTGTCPRGKKCKMTHRKPRKRPSDRTGNPGKVDSKVPKLSSSDQKKPDRQSQVSPQPGPSRQDDSLSVGDSSESIPAPQDSDDPSLPFKSRVLPAYISLFARPTNQTTPLTESQVKPKGQATALKIRPQL